MRARSVGRTRKLTVSHGQADLPRDQGMDMSPRGPQTIS
jgi:hypothetical protein